MRLRVLGLVAVLGCLLVVLVVGFGADSVSWGYSGGKWQYRILDVRDVLINCEITAAGIEQMNKVGVVAGTNLEQVFDQFGADGWELVSFSNEMAVFKRSR